MAKRDEVFAQGAGGGASWPPVRLAVDNTSDAGALSFGGGGGTYDGMETRVAKLEADVSHLVKQVDRIDARTEPMPADLAVLKERVSSLPTKDYLDDKFGRQLTRMGIVVAIVSAVIGIAFHFIPG